MEKLYVETVRLLLAVLPEIFTVPTFALKGGTAINLFDRDMPRLSVDIDLVYTDHRKSRTEALRDIAAGLSQARHRLTARGISTEMIATQDGDDVKLLARRGQLVVKVEVNHVFRGTLLPVVTKRLGSHARDLFTTEVTVPLLDAPELYGSKLVAALDRQHPRDFFDVQPLHAGGSLASTVLDCFVCYLAGHNRPIHEVLFSRDRDMTAVFENEFHGMAREATTLEQLEQTRRWLRKELGEQLTASHRRFLLSLVDGEPDWDLIGISHLGEMPALRWKVQNLHRLRSSNPRKFHHQAGELRQRL